MVDNLYDVLKEATDVKCGLVEINRNQNGDYYFIYSIPHVVNHIRPGSKVRDELLIVGVPKAQLVYYLRAEFPGSEFFIVDRKEVLHEGEENVKEER